jgi:Ankyrin repeats (many copies)
MPDEEELDLDQQLEALDLDTNFLESDTFDDDNDNGAGAPAQVEEPAAQPKAPSPLPTDSPPEDGWVDRTEIYSRHFKPNPQERQVLEEIASKLGVKSGLPKSGGGGGFVNPLDSILGANNQDDESDPHNPQSQWNRLVNGKATRQTQNLPVSIVLKQGPVLYKDIVDETTGETVSHHGCQLILFTRGFLLAQNEQKSSGLALFGAKKQDILVPLGSALWTDVKQIQTTAYQSLLITCGTNSNSVQFDILPATDLEGWRTALQTAAIQCHYNCSASDAHTEMGWQYRLCHTPWFTEAVTGDCEDLGLELSTSDSAEEALDQLDDYNSYAPLHYATRANHVEVIRKLLEAGANPNIEDGEGRTPMYFGKSVWG